MKTSRRSFITSSGQALGAGWLALNWPGITAAATHAHAAAADSGAGTITILTADEARDIDAIASQIIPTDDTPGAHEAGAVYFIDGALAGFFAAHREEFKSGHSEFAAAFAKDHGEAHFADLAADGQIEFLKSVDETPFFGTVRFLTILGLLASPGYGGNRDGIGWKLIGFDDQHVFQPPFGYYDRDYPGFVPYDTQSGS
jgi:gluconate 2-dehydrogenase gamma chain